MTAPDPRVGEDCATCLGCPDCGTTLSKRTTAAIWERLGKVSDGPWRAWDRGIGYEVHGPEGEPINSGHRETFTRGDAEFIASSVRDVAYLLSELADRDEKIARVEALHTRAFKPVEPWAKGYRFTGEHCAFDGEHWPCATIAAVAAAGGGGE